MQPVEPILNATYRIKRDRGRESIVRLVRVCPETDPCYCYVMRVEAGVNDRGVSQVGDEFEVELLWFAIRGALWPAVGGVGMVEENE